MNTDKKSLKQLLDELRTPELELEDRAHLLQANYLVQIEKVMEQQGLTQKALAAKIGVSASYISQLFTADKLTNFKMLARIEQALNIEFNTITVTSVAPSAMLTHNIVNATDEYKKAAMPATNKDTGDIVLAA